MKKSSVLPFIIYAFLSSCNYQQKNNSIAETGIVDSTSIAQDTGMQTAIENSYEYIKTLNVNEKLVYDVVAYGGSASAGQYAIIKRGADNKPDTIAQGKRAGIIVNTFLADLNKNGDNEIYIILQSADSNKFGNVIAYEMDKNGNANSIFFSNLTLGQSWSGHWASDTNWLKLYHGGDRFELDTFYADKKIFLHRDFFVPPHQAPLDIYYILNKNKLEIESVHTDK